MKLIYRIYQLFVVLPFLIFCSIACALVTTIGCTLGDGHYWGYYPGKWWARFIIWVSLLPIKVEGREHLRKDQSYVFVSNHQGSFDIFIIYGFLGRNFTDAERSSFERQGRDSIIASLPQSAIIENARASAARILVPLLTQMGYKEEDITITFRKEFTGDDLRHMITTITQEKRP